MLPVALALESACWQTTLLIHLSYLLMAILGAYSTRKRAANRTVTGYYNISRVVPVL